MKTTKNSAKPKESKAGIHHDTGETMRITGEKLLREEERRIWEAAENPQATPLGKMMDRIRAKHEILILTTPYGSNTVHSPNCQYCKTKS